MRGPGGEELPAGSYALLPNLTKVYFVQSGRDQDFSHVSGTTAPKCACIKRLAGASQVSPAVSWNLWPARGEESLRTRPVQSSWHIRWVCHSMFVEDSESHRCESTFCWVFPWPTLAQYLPRNECFRCLRRFPKNRSTWSLWCQKQVYQAQITRE